MTNRLFPAAFLALAFFLPGNLWAEKAKAIYPDGIVELEDGRKVSLAGIEMVPESLGLLSAVLAAGDFELRGEDKIAAADGVENVYVLCDLKLAERAAGVPIGTGQERVMLNELMITLGAAKVREDLEFREKGRFLKLQDAARQKGEGVWSYETIP